MFKSKWHAGRNSTGRIVMFSKGHKSCFTRLPFINYSFRDISITLIAGFFFIPFKNKVISLVFSSSGAVSYIPTPQNYTVFKFTKFKSFFTRISRFHKLIIQMHPYAEITYSFFIISRLAKNLPVCLLEILPMVGIQYTRSTGSKSIILRKDTRTGMSLVRLSSGASKVFSIYSLASKGNVCLQSNRKSYNTSAGYPIIYGKKPHVRGVAMNPVDHPHGGRAKAVKYQVTPWGKTTKFK